MLRCRIAIAVLTAWSGAALQAKETANDLLQQAQGAAVRGDSQAAVELATSAISKDARLADAYHLRGRERFRLGRIEASVKDFDRFVELRPELESRQWERGIAYYYARQFKKGAEQFERYQTFHDNDVENSVWRFLCMVPETGVKQARSVMLPIKNDRRVPMMQIYELYRGNLQPSDVLAACKKGNPAPQTLAGRRFYAHLYLGLYYEVTGEKELAEKYIRLAAEEQLGDNPRINRYMWDVARIHKQSLKERAKRGT